VFLGMKYVVIMVSGLLVLLGFHVVEKNVATRMVGSAVVT